MKRFPVRALMVVLLTSGTFIASPQFIHAQSEDRVGSLIELVRRRPDGKDRNTWRDERRDAARELGDSGDKRAVPVLVEIVETEAFDAVGEIAIVALGKLGDPRAIPALQSVVADSSRDRFVRKAARSSLEKLGASPSTSDDDNNDEDDTSALASTGLTSLSSGSAIGSESLKLAPAFGDDMLEARDELTIAVGQSRLEYDTISSEASLNGQASSHYLRLRERKQLALRYEGRGDVVAGAVNYEGDDASSRLASVNLAGAAEARLYTKGGTLFGLGRATALVGVDYLYINRPGPDNSTREKFLAADLALAIGGGYGRVINLGESMRVVRIEEVLRRRKILGRAISSELSERIMRAWWQLRHEQGFHDRLTATVALLREAGVLLGEPDAGASYAILQVLQDGQLNQRTRGLKVQLAIGESLLMRDDDLGLEEGRIESLLSKVSYGRQNSAGDNELRVEGFARYRILAEEGEATPWAASVQANWRDYHYSPNFDPIGALELGAALGASSDGLDDSEMATRLTGSAGWLWVPSRATRFRLAGEVRLEGGEMFVGALFAGEYGAIDAGYVGGAALN